MCDGTVALLSHFCHRARVRRHDRPAYDRGGMVHPQTVDPDPRESGSAAVEYVGLTALGASVVAALGAAIDSAAGDRVLTAIVERLVEAISGLG